MAQGGRTSGIQTVFILYHIRRYFIPDNPANSVYEFLLDLCIYDPEKINLNLDAVEAWSRGTLKSTAQMEDPLDVEVTPFELPDFADMDTTGSLKAIDQIDHYDGFIIGGTDIATLDYEPEADDGDIFNSEFVEEIMFSDAEDENVSPSTGAAYQDPCEFRDTMYIDEDNLSVLSSGQSLENSETNENAKPNTLQRIYPAGCRGLAWLINTKGCQRAVLRHIFDDIGFKLTEYVMGPKSMSTPNRMKCCDKHCPPDDLSMNSEIANLLLPSIDPYDILSKEENSTPSSSIVEYDEDDWPKTKPTPKQKNVVRDALLCTRYEI